MAVLAGADPQKDTGDRRLSWPVFLLTLAAVTSSSLSALSLYQLVALRAEVEGLRSDVCRTREEGREVLHRGQAGNMIGKRSSQQLLHQRGSEHAFGQIRRRRTVPGAEIISQPCLQLLANSSRKNYRKEMSSGRYTGIPWQIGLKRGSALEADNDRILVREEGFYYVYSQVFYRDNTFAMGHVILRLKRNIVGDEPSSVSLFRCIQNMNPIHSFNTCYTGGIVKLEAGDFLELLIPRATADVSLEGDSTFLGAVKLA
ncbi:tumor necrosis factor ligand superfamily member 13B [Pholidichthys leucotaenia]